MGRKRSRKRKHLYLFIACALWLSPGITGCTMLQVVPARLQYLAVDEQMAGGNYQAALEGYRQIVETYPKSADRALFCMGYLYAHPKNPDRDHQKAIDAFKRLVADHPHSEYRPPSESFLAVLGEIVNRDRRASGLKKQVDTLEKQVETLEKQIEKMKAIDRDLEEKRRLSPRK